MSQFKKNGTMELETSIGYSFSLIKTEYKQNKIYQNKKKTKRTVNLSFQSALCQQSEAHDASCAFFKMHAGRCKHAIQQMSSNDPASFHYWRRSCVTLHFYGMPP